MGSVLGDLQTKNMYRVAGNMQESYYPGEEVPQRRSNLDAPRVTVNNHRMTNVQLSGGDTIQGIRRNTDLGIEGGPPKPYESEAPMRPLRYTPGLKCDPALEALRPERQMKHAALSGGNEWKRMLIKPPQTFEGSFADANMQQFRPYPASNQMEDPWFASRLPDAQMQFDFGGYQYQQDALSQIRMRNRRYEQSCAMEGMQPAPAPMWRGPQQMHPQQMQPQMTEDMMMGGPMGDELSMIDHDLNMTRRATKPFVPVSDPAFNDLQKQINMMETMPTQPMRAPRVNIDDILGIDQLPAPAKRAPVKEEAPAAPRPKPIRNVGIADQIAIRSYVLGKTVGSSSEQFKLG